MEEIVEVGREMDLLVGAVNYLKKMEKLGIPTTFPEFNEERLRVEELCNPCLFLQPHINRKEDVTPYTFEVPRNKVVLITGPNNSGKTIFAQTMGLTAMLAMNGLPVPARRASLPEFDEIYTHFTRPEDIVKGEGALAREVRRIASLLKNVTPRSLVIVDEPIKSTSPEDSLEITLRFIRGLCRFGSLSLLATNSFSVANACKGLEGVELYQTETIELPEGGIYPTYRIIPGIGRSRGTRLADELGLSEENVMRILRERLPKEDKLGSRKS
jgi:DNA mismatch repair ATPase MutS